MRRWIVRTRTCHSSGTLCLVLSCLVLTCIVLTCLVLLRTPPLYFWSFFIHICQRSLRLISCPLLSYIECTYMCMCSYTHACMMIRSVHGWLRLHLNCPDQVIYFRKKKKLLHVCDSWNIFFTFFHFISRNIILKYRPLVLMLWSPLLPPHLLVREFLMWWTSQLII